MVGSKIKKIGFIGLGEMGSAIAARLLSVGYQVAGFDINASVLNRISAIGCCVAESPADAVADADMVQNAAQIEEALFHKHGAVEGLKTGSIIWIASTVSPQFIQQLEKLLLDKGLSLIDGPVSGGVTSAKSGDLTIMVGGDEDILFCAKNVLKSCGSNIFHVGAVGSGSTVKMINQVLTASHIALTAEAIGLGIKSGIDPSLLIEVIVQSAGNSRQFEKRAPRMISGDHTPQATVGIFLKDLSIALDSAQKLEFPTPITSVAYQIFTMAAGIGLSGESDTKIIDVYEKFGGLKFALKEEEE